MILFFVDSTTSGAFSLVIVQSQSDFEFVGFVGFVELLELVEIAAHLSGARNDKRGREFVEFVEFVGLLEFVGSLPLRLAQGFGSPSQ